MLTAWRKLNQFHGGHDPGHDHDHDDDYNKTTKSAHAENTL